MSTVLIGYSACDLTRAAFEAHGHDVWTCDLLPARGNSEKHLQCDIWGVLRNWKWDFAVLHPMCTYLTCSAAWAFKDPDFKKYPEVGYHQKVKPGTLPGPFGPVTMPKWDADTVAAALRVLQSECDVEGRYYVPVAWVKAISSWAEALYHEEVKPNPPVVAYALAWLDLVRSGDAGNFDADKIAEAEELLEPLRPLPPVPDAIAELLTRAREEQMIDGQQMDELRDLARRMVAK